MRSTPCNSRPTLSQWGDHISLLRTRPVYPSPGPISDSLSPVGRISLVVDACENRYELRPRLRLLKLRYLITNSGIVVEFPTLKAFHTRSQGRSASTVQPGDAMEKGGGRLKGCDRIDFAPSSHVVSRTSAELMDRV